MYYEVNTQRRNNGDNAINNNTSSKKGERHWGWVGAPLQCTQSGELLPLLSCAHPPQLATSCQPPPAGLRREHLELAFDTTPGIEETRKRGQKTATAVISLTRACVSIYYSLVPLESQSLMTLGNFLRALGLTSTPGSVELASCCHCLPSGLPMHPLIDLWRARPHSVCALWPSCLHTFSDLTP